MTNARRNAITIRTRHDRITTGSRGRLITPGPAVDRSIDYYCIHPGYVPSFRRYYRIHIYALHVPEYLYSLFARGPNKIIRVGTPTRGPNASSLPGRRIPVPLVSGAPFPVTGPQGQALTAYAHVGAGDDHVFGRVCGRRLRAKTIAFRHAGDSPVALAKPRGRKIFFFLLSKNPSFQAYATRPTDGQRHLTQEENPQHTNKRRLALVVSETRRTPRFETRRVQKLCYYLRSNTFHEEKKIAKRITIIEYYNIRNRGKMHFFVFSQNHKVFIRRVSRIIHSIQVAHTFSNSNRARTHNEVINVLCFLPTASDCTK